MHVLVYQDGRTKMVECKMVPNPPASATAEEYVAGVKEYLEAIEAPGSKMLYLFSENNDLLAQTGMYGGAQTKSPNNQWRFEWSPERYGLPTDCVGKCVCIAGNVCRIVGFNDRNRKYKVMLKNIRTGQNLKATVEITKQALLHSAAD